VVIFHFGADKPAEELKKIGYKRRNTILLKFLSEDPAVSQVFNFNYSNRKKFLQHFSRNFERTDQKIKDIFFTEVFTFGKVKIGLFNRLFNKIYFGGLKRRHSKRGLIAWLYWPNGYHDFKLSGVALPYVFDADHNLIDDPNLAASEKQSLSNLLREIAASSNLIVCASKSMLSWFTENGAKAVYRLRNGIDMSRFQNRSSKRNKFSVVYCGLLSHWVNYDLFVQLVKSNPDIEFVIIGRAFLTDSYEYVRQFANVQFLGEKSSEEVASLLPTFDAGIALYKSDTILDGDSMKIYEYLAAGLPVVCTNYHVSLKEDFESLLFIANTSEEISTVLHTIRDKSLVLNADAVSSFLDRSGWDKRVSDVIKKLNGSTLI